MANSNRKHAGGGTGERTCRLLTHLQMSVDRTFQRNRPGLIRKVVLAECGAGEALMQLLVAEKVAGQVEGRKASAERMRLSV